MPKAPELADEKRAEIDRPAARAPPAERIAEHDATIEFMNTILDHLKESGVSLDLTKAQSAELTRWLDEIREGCRCPFVVAGNFGTDPEEN